MADVPRLRRQAGRATRIAILDLGTNTFHLLIADLHDGSFQKVFQSRRTVKLGQGGIRKGIGPAGFSRGLEVLSAYAAIVRKFRPDLVRAYATSGIRSAANGATFLLQARRLGLPAQVITGEREAAYIWKGVRLCVPPSEAIDLVMDIGGGSTEFLAGNKSIEWKHSFNSGVARLKEWFPLSEPAKPGELRRIHEYLEEAWQPLQHAMSRRKISRLIGSSGSFETFASMIAWDKGGSGILPRKRMSIGLSDFKNLHRRLISSTTQKRMAMKGLVKMRVDSIVYAGICTMFVLRKFKIREIVLSRYALKEGVLLEEMKKVRS